MPEYQKKQVEFPPLQTHSKKFEAAIIGLCVVCVVIVLVIVLGTNIGDEFRP
jgi:hypothetical protein